MSEIGPRFTLNLIKIFEGALGGITLYENPRYQTPNAVRRRGGKREEGGGRRRGDLVVAAVEELNVLVILLRLYKLYPFNIN